MTRLYALDVGGSHVACAVVEDRAVLGRETVTFADPGSFTALLPAIEAALERTAARAGGGGAGLAIAFPGIVDPHAARVLSTPAGKFEDSVGFDFTAWARARLGVPVRLELDARMTLLGERCAGSLAGVDDAALLTLGTGVGSAAVIEGRLLRGRHFLAGSLGGHLSTSARGRACICGGVGCIEAEASTWALPALAAEDPGYAASGLAAEPSLDFEAVFRLAGEGDGAAVRLRDHCVGVWSAAVVNLIHAYDPEVVAVSGGVMAAADHILPVMREHVRRHAWTPWGGPELRAGTLGPDAALLGAEPLWEMAA